MGPAIPVRARSIPCIWQCSGKVAVAGFSCARMMVVPPSDPVGLIGKLTRVASDAHVTAGPVALSITSRATGSSEFFESITEKYSIRFPGLTPRRCRLATTT